MFEGVFVCEFSMDQTTKQIWTRPFFLEGCVCVCFNSLCHILHSYEGGFEILVWLEMTENSDVVGFDRHGH